MSVSIKKKFERCKVEMMDIKNGDHASFILSFEPSFLNTYILEVYFTWDETIEMSADFILSLNSSDCILQYNIDLKPYYCELYAKGTTRIFSDYD